MSEILTIRLNNDPLESIPWMVWSTSQQQVIASGNADRLAQLTAYAKDREVVILADSTALTLTSIAIPPGANRQLENVLPFLLEDELAQDVSQLHICVLEKLDDMAHVAIIEHRLMQTWLADLSQAGLATKRVIPDCLCLPLEEQGYSAALLNERWIVRTAKTSGFAAEADWLPILLTTIQDKQAAGLPPIYSYSPLPNGAGENWQEKPAMLVMEILSQGCGANQFNLLTGPYKPTNQWAKYFRYARELVVAITLLLLVSVVEQVIQTSRMEAEAKAINSQINQAVRSVLPQNQRIPTTSYMRRLLETELSRLSGANSELSFLTILAQIAPALKQVAGIELTAIDYDAKNGQIKFDAQGRDFADFEKLRAALAQSFSTELGRLNKNDKNIVTGAFVLKKEQ